jgi:NADH-quinone oxidoreductase subunit G
MDTVTLTIDGTPVTVEKGKTVLQAAIEHGFLGPVLLLTTQDGDSTGPAASVSSRSRRWRSCRLRAPRRARTEWSCRPTAPDVVQARAGVFEFLLVNHPLDCPVCDKGGECPLQDFSYSFGRSESRMEFPRRTFDGEGVKADVDFGPTLMLNRNRCILCTRCIRFMREIDGDPQIGVVARGSDSQIATFNEQGVHSLLSGNLMDVCPVGAITTRDYRFKSRPWDNPDAVDTICTLCSKGCATTAWIKAKPEWAKGARLVRLTPRYEPAVNGYWMCDIGRFGYHWIEGRRAPVVPNGARRRGTPAVDDVGGRSQGAGRARRLGCGKRHHVPDVGACVQRGDIPDRADGERDRGELEVERETTARRHEVRVPVVDAPNVNGARDLGLPVGAGNNGDPDLSAVRHAIESGQVPALYVFDPGPAGSIGDVSWIASARQSGKLSLLVYQGVLMTELAAAADIVLPGSAWVEKDGTYTNDQGRVQPAAKVFSAPWRRDGRPRRLRARGRGARPAHALEVGCRGPRRHRGAPEGQPGLRGARLDQLLASSDRQALAAGIEPLRALEVGLHVPGSQHSEVGRD